MDKLTLKLDSLNLNIKSKNAFQKKIDRPTFYTKTKKPIRAGGVLFVKDGEYLLQKKSKKNGFQYSDFGGKTDISDKDIIDTIIREVQEETNNQILLTRNQLNKAKKKYLPKSKYLLFVIKTKRSFKKEIDQMGTQEINTDIMRTVEWNKPNYDEFHFRLKTYFKNIKISF